MEIDVNVLNTPMKTFRLVDWIKLKDPGICFKRHKSTKKNHTEKQRIQWYVSSEWQWEAGMIPHKENKKTNTV